MGVVCDGIVRVKICTLSESLAEQLKKHLTYWAAGECAALQAEVSDCFDFSEQDPISLLFADLDSVELPESFRPETQNIGLIILSEDAGRAIRSYRWHPTAMLKPDFDRQRLKEAMKSCERFWRRGRVYLEAQYQRQNFRLPLGSICYVEAFAHYSMFHQASQTFLIRYGISELAFLMPNPPFFRCHRSYLVHLDSISGMTYTELFLKDSTSLPVGRTYIAPLREALEEWQRREAYRDGFRADM